MLHIGLSDYARPELGLRALQGNREAPLAGRMVCALRRSSYQSGRSATVELAELIPICRRRWALSARRLALAPLVTRACSPAKYSPQRPGWPGEQWADISSRRRRINAGERQTSPRTHTSTHLRDLVVRWIGPGDRIVRTAQLDGRNGRWRTLAVCSRYVCRPLRARLPQALRDNPPARWRSTFSPEQLAGWFFFETRSAAVPPGSSLVDTL
jgi:hypothetical protein